MNTKILKKNKKPLTSSMEDYLEAIYQLSQEKRFVRVKDIAKQVGVKMPTVTSMLKNLRDRGHVFYEKYEFVELTKEGEKVGREIQRRHQILFKFLTKILKIDNLTADQEACKMEHSLSPSTLQRVVDFMEFIQICPRAGMEWLDHFEEFRKSGNNPGKCLERGESEIPCQVIQDRVEILSKMENK